MQLAGNRVSRRTSAGRRTMSDSQTRAFMEITGCDQAVAEIVLAAAGGDMDSALAFHYDADDHGVGETLAAVSEADLREEVERDRDLKAALSAAGPSLLDIIRASEANQQALLASAAKATKKIQRESGCMVCGRWDEPDGNPMLVCDKVARRKGSKKRRRCDQLCHLQCCTPLLGQVPEGPWHCSDCATSGTGTGTGTVHPIAGEEMPTTVQTQTMTTVAPSTVGSVEGAAHEASASSGVRKAIFPGEVSVDDDIDFM